MQVMALVGPHGSAFLNMHWVAPGALVLEVMAAGQWGNEVFWLMAAGLGHNYWSLPVKIFRLLSQTVGGWGECCASAGGLAAGLGHTHWCCWSVRHHCCADCCHGGKVHRNMRTFG
jgi:hypothetical protein